MSLPQDPLQPYRAKRSADYTPEPTGRLGAAGTGGRLYVFHKHAASHLHWDLRLELGGVLKSWAVPKGPSFDQADKRLAVQVEDHPIEYAEFEGVIPPGNYGAGAVIVWDRGTWDPIEDPVAGLEKGKLLFELRGHKLAGRWTLVRIRKSARDWLLIKERDAWMTPGGRAVPENSVLSGLTVEELRDGVDRAASIQVELDRLRAPQRRVQVQEIEPMLAESAEAPFSGPAWLFEFKLDGYRVLAQRSAGEVRLLTRHGREASAVFPEVARAIAALPFRHLVLDGEVIASDEHGLPSFQRLQRRGRFLRPGVERQVMLENPVTYCAFDLLAFGDWDLRPLPLVERKRLLQMVLPPAGVVVYLEHIAEAGEQVFAEAERLGLEGLVAKRADAPYTAGRSAAWLKVRLDRTGDFVVVGFTEPKRSRVGLGALHVADYTEHGLTYAGRVGTGFGQVELAHLRRELDATRRATPPCVGVVADAEGPGTVWVEPERVCEVRYKEWTEEPLLRQAVFLRWRDDKAPRDCVRERPMALPELEPSTRDASSGARWVRFTNLDKVFWPDQGYTKGDLVAYYRAIAQWLLPYLRDRPVVLTRYPDGIAGKSFFQKDAPAWKPEWVRTERMWSEDTQREIDYFVADDERSLLYLANLAAIPLHIWSSRVGSLERPDWCILDLDPKGAPMAYLARVAQSLHRVCDELGLPHYVKTSGSTGLHVLIPLGRRLTYAQSRAFGELLARVVVAREPDVATVTRAVHRRHGKVYLDYAQNGHGRLIVAPFSVRPLPGAPISMPLRWEEVTDGLELSAYTIRTAPERMQGLGEDPLAPVLEERADLAAAIGKLAV